MNPSGINKVNRYDEIFDGVKAPLEGAHRNEDMGFIRYFSQRQFHFTDLYRLPYSEENARKVLMERRKKGW